MFFGGGTPSLLEPEEVGDIVGACRGSFAVAGDAEVTLEQPHERCGVVRGKRAAKTQRLQPRIGEDERVGIELDLNRPVLFQLPLNQ